MSAPDPSLPPTDDVRMRGFADRATVQQALAWLDGKVQQRPSEEVALAELAGRVLAADMVSPLDVPGFSRAMMDGFALLAADTDGATAYNALPLKIVGSSLPGRPFRGEVQHGQAVRIMTGAPLPKGADAVLPAERTEFDDCRVLVQGEVSPGKHIGLPGEDVRRDTVVLQRRRRLRPQDVGVIASLGMATAPVIARPRVQLLVTGDELLTAGQPPEAGRIFDANGPMLSALVRRDGGQLPGFERVRDDSRQILAAMRRPDADIIIVSGGTSVGQEDHAPRLVAEHGELAIHGIAMRPSSPTGLGLINGCLVFLLPGNPVSCLCAYDFFAGRAIRAAGGFSPDWPYRLVRLPLKQKISSAVGRVDYGRVTIQADQVVPLAIGGASVLTSTTRADGFVIVPADSEGYPPGAFVDVYLYDDLQSAAP